MPVELVEGGLMFTGTADMAKEPYYFVLQLAYQVSSL